MDPLIIPVIIGTIFILFVWSMRPKEYLHKQEEEEGPRFDPYVDELSEEGKAPVSEDAPDKNESSVVDNADGKTKSSVGYGVPNEVQCPSTVLVRRPKTRVAYVLFAIFFGSLGIHNFYALRSRAATTQFLMTVLSLGLLSPISGIWAIIDICTVDRDGRGNLLE